MVVVTHLLLQFLLDCVFLGGWHDPFQTMLHLDFWDGFKVGVGVVCDWFVDDFDLGLGAASALLVVGDFLVGDHGSRDFVGDRGRDTQRA